MLSEDEKKFISQNLHADPLKLLLKASQYPAFDIPKLANQLICRAKAKEKIPLWAENTSVFFPSKLALEQASSQLTALYKAQTFGQANKLADLTGGLGVDDFFFAKTFQSVTYVEKNPELTTAARYNFACLGATNIEVIQQDAVQFVLDTPQQYDLIYLDPARRDTDNKKLVAFEDCSPDLLKIKPLIFEKTQKILVKASPMIDLEAATQQLEQISHIYLVAHHNEMKEVLFLLEKSLPSEHQPHRICLNIKQQTNQLFTFSPQEEANAQVRYTSQIGTFLYEPNAAIMKAGGFKILAQRFGAYKLHPNSHLYTTDNELLDFCGRGFRVEEVLEFGKKTIKHLSLLKKANVSTRNFPLSAEQLRKEIGLTDGGDIYLFGTTDLKNRKLIIKCLKI